VDFQTVLKAAGETETTHESIQDWLQLDEGDPEFLPLREEEISALIFLHFFSSALPTASHFSCIFI
jgi:hypothetical protein